MQVGVKFPNETIIDDVHAIRDFVQAAEELGFARLLTFEHVLGAEQSNRNPPLPVAYDENSPFHDSLTFLAFVAAVTTSINLATGVIVSPQRQTALLAKQAAEVAILSRNRLTLGLGVGWNYVEFEGLGADFSRRGVRQEEQIGLLRRLWTDPVVDFHGRFHDIERAGIAPRPAAPIPIWLGGYVEATYRRAARMANGFIGSVGIGMGSSFDPRALVEHLRELVSEAGREQSEFGIDLLIFDPVSPAQFAALFEEWVDRGVTYLTLTQLGDQSTPQHCIRVLESYKEAISGRALPSHEPSVGHQAGPAGGREDPGATGRPA